MTIAMIPAIQTIGLVPDGSSSSSGTGGGAVFGATCSEPA
jgi:hypothetical protein